MRHRTTDEYRQAIENLSPNMVNMINNYCAEVNCILEAVDKVISQILIDNNLAPACMNVKTYACIGQGEVVVKITGEQEQK